MKRVTLVAALAVLALAGMAASPGLARTAPGLADPLVALALAQAEFTAPDGALGDDFGYSVAIDGDTAIAGAPNDDLGAGAEQGSAYVFTRSGTGGWTFQQKLVAGDGAPRDWFGAGVAVSGDTALVSALFDTVGTRKEQGSVYVFTRVGSTWHQQQQLVASDGEARDGFGWSVALSGDSALIGAKEGGSWRGSAYVFTRAGTTWSEQQKLVADDCSAEAEFASSLAISGDTVLIGATHDDVGKSQWQGSAYVYTRSGTSWSLQQKLVAPDGLAEDQFGSSVAVSGDTALVGAVCDDVGAAGNQGSAYVFTRAGSTWRLQQKFTASDGHHEYCFGESVALCGDTALIGAMPSLPVLGLWPDAAYVFVRSGTSWSQQQKLVISDEPLAYFAGSVAVSGDTALVGASGDDPARYRGSAYCFQIGSDTAGPTIRAFPAVARTGKNVHLKFRIDDPLPSCGLATLRLRILKGTRLLKTVGARETRDCNLPRWRTWRCTLPAGRYTFKVYATDVAGHAQRKAGSGRLTVR